MHIGNLGRVVLILNTDTCIVANAIVPLLLRKICQLKMLNDELRADQDIGLRCGLADVQQYELPR